MPSHFPSSTFDLTYAKRSENRTREKRECLFILLVLFILSPHFEGMRVLNLNPVVFRLKREPSSSDERTRGDRTPGEHVIRANGLVTRQYPEFEKVSQLLYLNGIHVTLHCGQL